MWLSILFYMLYDYQYHFEYLYVTLLRGIFFSCSICLLSSVMKRTYRLYIWLSNLLEYTTIHMLHYNRASFGAAYFSVFGDEKTAKSRENMFYMFSVWYIKILPNLTISRTSHISANVDNLQVATYGRLWLIPAKNESTIAWEWVGGSFRAGTRHLRWISFTRAFVWAKEPLHMLNLSSMPRQG